MVLIPARFSAPGNIYVSGVTGLSYDDGKIAPLPGKRLTPCKTVELPRFIIDDEGLDELLPTITHTAYKIYRALGRRLGSENPIVKMSIKEITTATGIKSEQTVRTGLNELVKLELITRIGENAQRGYLLNKRYLRRYELPLTIHPSVDKIYRALGRNLGSENTIVDMSFEEFTTATGIKSEQTVTYNLHLEISRSIP